jgi:diguanylate cyclase (GGDEF)-like protein
MTEDLVVLQGELERLKGELRGREEEVTLLKRENRKLSDLAYRDRLTGLGSRIHLEETFEYLEDKAEPLCVLMIDLDHFKKINDKHGHGIGDEVLERFGAILKTVSHRQNDVCARWGGEEFAVVLRNCTLEGAGVYVERLLRRIREDLVIHRKGGCLIRTTASIGVAQRAPREAMTALLARADQAMYEAKRAGRDCVKVADKP